MPSPITGLMKGTAIRSSGNCLARGDGERVVFIKTIRIDGLLSFPPGSPAVGLRPLNVLIGPNGSGKSNFVKAIRLLRNTACPDRTWLRMGATKATVAVETEGKCGHITWALEATDFEASVVDDAGEIAIDVAYLSASTVEWTMRAIRS